MAMCSVWRYDRSDSIQAFELIWNLTQKELMVQKYSQSTDLKRLLPEMVLKAIGRIIKLAMQILIIISGNQMLFYYFYKKKIYTFNTCLCSGFYLKNSSLENLNVQNLLTLRPSKMYTDAFVMFTRTDLRKYTLHRLLTSGSSSMNGCHQNVFKQLIKNITIIHK